MSFTTKPSWLVEPARVKDITDYHLYLPNDTSRFTSLPDETSFRSGVKQFLYWKGQLLPSLQENIVFLAFLGPNGLKPPNVINVTLALKDICDLKQVCEFYQGANTNFLALSFSSKTPVDNIMSKFLYFDDSIVLPFTYMPSQDYRFRLLWLPPRFDVNRVHHLLNKYSSSHRIRRESIALADSTFAPTNVISGVLTIKPGGDVNQLPHLIQLPAPHKGCALLTIETRPPLCLKCRQVGHTRPHCNMIKCTKCTKVHFPDAICGFSSYSVIASRNVTPSSTEDWVAEIPDISPDITSASDSKTSPNQDSTHTALSSSIPQLIKSPSFPSNLSLLDYSASDTAKCDRTCGVSTTLTKELTKELALDAATFDTSSASTTKTTPTSLSLNHTTSSDAIIKSSSLSNTGAKSKTISTMPRPVPVFTAGKDSAKVHVSDLSSNPSNTARSHLFTYSLASKDTTSSSVPSASNLSSSLNTTLFGDPDPNSYFSSDNEMSNDTEAGSFPQQMELDDTITRKRKVSSSSPLPPTSQQNIICKAGDTPSDFSHISDSPDSGETDEETMFFMPSSSLEPVLSTLQQAQHTQVTNMFAATPAQVIALEQACPEGRFTSDLLKGFKIFIENGITITNIIASPHILKMRFSELKRKTKYLQKHLGAFTVEDLFQYEGIDSKIFSGKQVTPTPFFS